MELLLSSTGRLTRTSFLVAAAGLLVLAVACEAVFGTIAPWLSGWVAYPVLLFSAACILSKRLHDRGRSGWWGGLILAALIAVWPLPRSLFDLVFVLVLVWAFVELGIMPGQPGANRFGADPAAKA